MRFISVKTVNKEEASEISAKNRNEDDFTLDWFKYLDWVKDPFAEPVENVKEFYGGFKKQREILNMFLIKGSSYGTISGEYGSGKTTLIEWLLSELKNYRKKIITNYIDCKELKQKKARVDDSILELKKELYKLRKEEALNTNLFEKISLKLKSFVEEQQYNLRLREKLEAEKWFFEELLYPLLSSYERKITRPYYKVTKNNFSRFVASKTPKDYLIILDNLDYLPKEQLGLLPSLISQGNHVKFIISAPKPFLLKNRLLSSQLKDSLKINLDKFTIEDIKDILDRRILLAGGNLSAEKLFTEKELRKIREKSPTISKALAIARELAIKKSFSISEKIRKEKEREKALEEKMLAEERKREEEERFELEEAEELPVPEKKESGKPEKKPAKKEAKKSNKSKKEHEDTEELIESLFG